MGVLDLGDLHVWPVRLCLEVGVESIDSLVDELFKCGVFDDEIGPFLDEDNFYFGTEIELEGIDQLVVMGLGLGLGLGLGDEMDHHKGGALVGFNQFSHFGAKDNSLGDRFLGCDRLGQLEALHLTTRRAVLEDNFDARLSLFWVEGFAEDIRGTCCKKLFRVGDFELGGEDKDRNELALFIGSQCFNKAKHFLA
ncbi:MAG: hypothetical protein S4CHLAM102_07150 [Chlamydiia bacterium]|nr:hypothetical protein [Chlamydiia bacterium]